MRKLQLFRSQCDVFKRQLQELQVKAADETKRADKAAFEAQRNSDKLAALQREKEVTLFRFTFPILSLCEFSLEIQTQHALQDYHLSTSRVVVHAKLSSFDRCRPCARKTHSCWKTLTTSAAPSQSRVSAKASKSCAILSHTTCFCVNWTRWKVI